MEFVETAVCPLAASTTCFSAPTQIVVDSSVGRDADVHDSCTTFTTRLSTENHLLEVAVIAADAPAPQDGDDTQSRHLTNALGRDGANTDGSALADQKENDNDSDMAQASKEASNEVPTNSDAHDGREEAASKAAETERYATEALAHAPLIDCEQPTSMKPPIAMQMKHKTLPMPKLGPRWICVGQSSARIRRHDGDDDDDDDDDGVSVLHQSQRETAQSKATSTTMQAQSMTFVNLDSISSDELADLEPQHRPLHRPPQVSQDGDEPRALRGNAAPQEIKSHKNDIHKGRPKTRLASLGVAHATSATTLQHHGNDAQPDSSGLTKSTIVGVLALQIDEGTSTQDATTYVALLTFKPLAQCVMSFGKRNSNVGSSSTFCVWLGSSNDNKLRLYAPVDATTIEADDEDVATTAEPRSGVILRKILNDRDEFTFASPVTALAGMSYSTRASTRPVCPSEHHYANGAADGYGDGAETVDNHGRLWDGSSEQRVHSGANDSTILAVACRDGTIQVFTWEDGLDLRNLRSKTIIVDGPICCLDVTLQTFQTHGNNDDDQGSDGDIGHRWHRTVQVVAGSLCGYACRIIKELPEISTIDMRRMSPSDVEEGGEKISGNDNNNINRLGHHEHGAAAAAGMNTDTDESSVEEEDRSHAGTGLDVSDPNDDNWDGPYMIAQGFWDDAVNAEDCVLSVHGYGDNVLIGTHCGRVLLYRSPEHDSQSHRMRQRIRRDPYHRVWQCSLPYSVHGLRHIASAHGPVSLLMTTRRTVHLFQQQGPALVASPKSELQQDQPCAPMFQAERAKNRLLALLEEQAEPIAESASEVLEADAQDSKPLSSEDDAANGPRQSAKVESSTDQQDQAVNADGKNGDDRENEYGSNDDVHDADGGKDGRMNRAENDTQPSLDRTIDSSQTVHTTKDNPDDEGNIASEIIDEDKGASNEGNSRGNGETTQRSQSNPNAREDEDNSEGARAQLRAQVPPFTNGNKGRVEEKNAVAPGQDAEEVIPAVVANAVGASQSIDTFKRRIMPPNGRQDEQLASNNPHDVSADADTSATTMNDVGATHAGEESGTNVDGDGSRAHPSQDASDKAHVEGAPRHE